LENDLDSYSSCGKTSGRQAHRYSLGRMVGYDKSGYNFADCSDLMRLDATMASFASPGFRI
ncbi:MAG: hypothetical protein ACN6OY_04015, partial [Pseudomonas alloputida]